MTNVILANLKPNEAAAKYVIEALFKIHQEKYGQLKSYKLVWTTNHGRLGYCKYGKKEIGISLLHLSGDVKELQDTLIHEEAHAICGREHNHDIFWVAVAKAMGGTGKRTGTLGADNTRFKGTCPICNANFYRMKAKKNLYHPCELNKATKTKLVWSVNK